MREIKNAFNGLISKLNWAREKISEVEDKSVETTPPKNTERKESEEQNKQDFQEVCNIGSNITGIRKRRMWQKFAETMAENIPKLI